MGRKDLPLLLVSIYASESGLLRQLMMDLSVNGG